MAAVVFVQTFIKKFSAIPLAYGKNLKTFRIFAKVFKADAIRRTGYFGNDQRRTVLYIFWHLLGTLRQS